ncbi:S8 family serine peptidase [Nocardioides humilatus]|uniref:S8 family serine peptidase n=1 Tax=Nocardioides humilatus TaxID=2607660 RepID=A0A5B1LCQ0_9ACTN|nr:S8 family serine peptidase [Nocardioides humilatus]KAA1418531.1 S8 family serine peptidase [Nocardioides humilatus]
MHPLSRAATALSALAVTLVAVHVPAQADPTGSAGSSDALTAPHVARSVAPSKVTVTLVTGDVVTVRTQAEGDQMVEVERPAGAVGSYRMQQYGGDLYVIPDEVVPLLGADLVDRRLFDVTDLIAMGYDDAHRATVPTIVTYRSATTSRAQHATPRGSTLVRRLRSIDGAALATDKDRARTFWEAIAPEVDLTDSTPTLESGVEKLWLDGQVTVQGDGVAQIGAPDAWAAGYDGTGVTVAVLDTGIDADHPDFEGQIADTQSFVPDEAVADVNGHGTHVAGTIAGTGAAADGKHKGVAPGADLIVGKVLAGPAGQGQDSWVLAGMEWAAQSGADVVNMSLGDSMASDGKDPMSQAVNALSEQYGTLFVIAAGNAGPESISTPGAAADALTVGAVDDADRLAGFSSTGPIFHTSALKPDLTAPGVDITAPRSQDIPGGSGMYQTMSGTSMATPHVAGAAAILKQEHPGWSGQQLKEHLMSSSLGLDPGYSPYDVGTGRVDVAAAITTDVRSTGSVLLGNFDWPHEPTDSAVTKKIRFTNAGDTAVTLDLAMTQNADAFTLGASTVTVRAGGVRGVPITGDPAAVDFGRYVGYVVGTDSTTGDPVTRTSLGLVKEEERYDLKIKLVGRDGAPAAGWVGIAKAGDPWPWAAYVDGETTLRTMPGSYVVSTYLDVQGETPDRAGLAVLVDPETVLDQDRTVTLDARDARLLTTTAPELTEDRQRKVDFQLIDSTGLEVRSAYPVDPRTDDVYVLPTEPVSEGSFILTTRWRKGEPLLGLTTADGSTRFDTLVQAGSALATSRRTLATVFAGDGAAADFAGLDAAGKVAVVRRSDAVGSQERASAAADAGATALIVVNDGPGGLLEYVGSASIPVATVHRDQGRQLVRMAKAGRRVVVDQDAYTDYVYDLTRDYPDAVPDRPLTYTPTQGQLARIDARYYGVKAGEASGYRGDLTLTPTLGSHEREWHPGKRTEWVTPGQVWVESHAQNVQGALPWEVVSHTNTFATRTTTRLDWFRPVVRPAFSDAFAVRPSRARDFMTWNLEPWSSSSTVLDLGGYLPWGESPEHTRVFQGDTLIHDNVYSSDMQWKEVPAGNLPYRVVHDASRSAKIFRLSTSTHTEWTFLSDTVDSDYFEDFSVLQLDYDLESDLRGDVLGGKRHPIAVRATPSHSGTPLPAAVSKVTLEVSYDDAHTWRTVTLTRGGGDGWWRGSIRPPAGHGFVSVRASARTPGGYSIEQRITRAYGVR